MEDVRAHTIYFIVTDRFHDSDPTNDGGRNPESYDATHQNWNKYWGGDLGGVRAKLDYLAGLGASAVWITPVFDQVDDVMDAEGRGHAAYHGYWAKDFRRIDEHLVTSQRDIEVFRHDDTVFDKLLGDMRARGITLVLDVVCNHSSPAVRKHKGELYDDGQFLTSFDDDRLGWYHRTGTITDWRDERVVQEGELCGLADFNENIHTFRAYIKRVMKDWIDKGVGALRVDTVKHMPLWFWQEWVSDLRTHRPQLFLVGEWFQGGCYDGASVEFANRSGMTIFDFALQRALEEALARSQYEGFLAVDRVFAKDELFLRPTHLVTFVDNHDMPRFQSLGATARRLEMAVALILVARGIPCIYYGTEQYLHDDTNGGQDPYNRPMMSSWDTSTPLYCLIARLARVRRENTALARGYQETRYLSSDSYVFERGWGDSVCLAAFNRGAARSVGPIKTSLPDGDHACVVTGRRIAVRAGQIDKLDLGGEDVLVLSHAVPEPDMPGTRVTFQLNGFASQFGERVAIVGDAPELGGWDFARSRPLRYVSRNLWEGDVGFEASAGSVVRYKFVVLRDGAAPRVETAFPRRGYIPASGTDRRADKWGG